MRIFTIIPTLLLFTIQLLSQQMSLAQIENDLHGSYKKIVSYRFDADTIALSSLEKENDTFMRKMLSYTSLYPQTLIYKFDSLQKDKIDVVSSDDKLFRIYSWNTWMGGTMQDFKNVFQYRAGTKVYSKRDYDTSMLSDDNYAPFYSQIFTLKTSNKAYYIAINNGIYSTKDASQSVKIFAIENHLLNDKVKLIKTKTGLANSIDIEFDFFSVVDRPERPLKLIKYDSTTKQLFIPIVLENGKVTDRFIIYQFNGQYFEKISVRKKES